MNNQEFEEEKTKGKGRTVFKWILRFTVGILAEIFMGAVTNSVLANTEGNRVARIGAKAGGFLVGMAVSDHVSNFICDEVDEALEDLDDIKEAMDNE